MHRFRFTVDDDQKRPRRSIGHSAALFPILQGIQAQAGKCKLKWLAPEDDGRDSMVFADITGERNVVLAQEIDANNLKKVVENADQRGFQQVTPVSFCCLALTLSSGNNSHKRWKQARFFLHRRKD